MIKEYSSHIVSKGVGDLHSGWVPGSDWTSLTIESPDQLCGSWCCSRDTGTCVDCSNIHTEGARTVALHVVVKIKAAHLLEMITYYFEEFNKRGPMIFNFFNELITASEGLSIKLNIVSFPPFSILFQSQKKCLYKLAIFKLP